MHDRNIGFKQLNPILDIENDLLITRRGDYSLVYKVELPAVFSLTEDDYLQLNNSISNALNILSDGLAIQRMDFYYPVSPGIGLDKRSYLAYRDIRKMNGKRVIKSETYYIFTKLANPNHRRSFANTLFDTLTTGKVNGLFNEKHYTTGIVRNFIFEIEGFVNSIEKCLDKAKSVTFKKLNKEGIEELVFGKYFSLEMADSPLNLHLDYADLKDKARVGNNVINIFSMEADGMPPSIYTSIIEGNFRKEGVSELPVSFLHDTAFNLDFPHIVNQIIYTLPQKKTFDGLIKKMKLMTGAAVGNAQNKRNAEYISGFLEEFQGKASEKLVKFHYGLILIAPSLEDEIYRDCYNQVRGLLGNTKMKFSVNTYNSLRYFFSYCPGCAAEISEEDRAICLTNHAACFGVYESNLKSGTSGVLFIDRKTDWPIQVDLWYHPLITNKNQLIVGPSGTGKSFTSAYFIRHYLDNGDDVVVVDLGRSYARLNEYYNGIIIECSAKNPLTFNPFLVVEKNKENIYSFPSEDDSEFITLLLFTSWQSANQGSKITSEVNAVLKELILLFYEHINKNKLFPDFTEFYHFVKEQFEQHENYKSLSQSTFNKESFLLVMRSFIKGGRGYNDGQYHYIFNVDKNPEIFDSKFVIFELEEIKSNKVLFPISYYILSKVVLDKLLKQTKLSSKRLYFVLDEVWILLSGEYGDAEMFIEYSYRTFRKHDGSVCISTQDINDIFKNPKVGSVIKENCDIKILKMQNKDKLSDISNALQLSDHNKNILFSMTDKHRDVYIQFKDMGCVYRIETDEFTVGINSSDPDHKKWIETDREKTKSLATTLENFANQFSKR